MRSHVKITPRNYFSFPGVIKVVGAKKNYQGIDSVVTKILPFFSIDKAELLKKAGCPTS